MLICSSLLAVLRFLACCDLKMIYAACLILCAAGNLFTSNSADSANVFAESNITLSNGVLPMISIIQYPYTNGGKPNYTISQFTLNSKLVADQAVSVLGKYIILPWVFLIGATMITKGLHLMLHYLRNKCFPSRMLSTLFVSGLVKLYFSGMTYLFIDDGSGKCLESQQYLH